MLSIFKSKKTKTIIILLFSISILVLFSSIVYSAFSSTMNITGIAHSRVEADVRITDFSLEETVNATSSYEEFGKDHISTSISFKENAYAIYKVEVTNYGTTDVGIYSIEGLPEGITYELIDYNIKDKLCDNTGKCNSFSKTTFNIKFTSTNKEVDFTLKFNFKVIHNIAYINFTGSYPTDVYDGESLSVDVSVDSPKYVYIESDKDMIYNYENNMLTLNNVKSDITIEAIYNTEYKFYYTGDYQTFTVPYDGIYKVELWGASSGGNEKIISGKGAYTSGNLCANKNDKFYIYVGEGGKYQTKPQEEMQDTFNGGSKGSSNHDTGLMGSGGGATDIRLINGNYKDETSLRSRIMVAAGGGSGIDFDTITYKDGLSFSIGSDAGGLIGYEGKIVDTRHYNQEKELGTHPESVGGSQTSGGTTQYKGYFGYGGAPSGSSPGAGGGYYGGEGGYDTGWYISSGAGGSSFISGHNGCVAIESSSSTTPRNDTSGNQCTDGTTDITCSQHYSNYIFTNTIMIDGAGYNWTTEKGNKTGMPTHDGTTTMTGNEGNGYAKITLLQPKDLYKIKYTDIEGNYQSTIYKGNNLVVDLKNNAPTIVVVLENGVQREYSYKNGIVTVNSVNGNIEIKEINSIYNYDYTGDYQTFTVPYNGIYKIELWGAQGGYEISDPINYPGGYGGYVSGEIVLNKDEKLYVYIGEQPVNKSKEGGWNGGGSTAYDGSGGGGATDVRIVLGEWNDFDSLKSRIMVAGGGGGGYGVKAHGAGGLSGYERGNVNDGGAGAQTSGGSGGNTSSYTSCISTNIKKGGPSNGLTENGSFGKGGFSTYYGTGGGSGYYGGGGGTHFCIRDAGGSGGGGSSFISGHEGCDSISELSTSSSISHTGQSIHYSGYNFSSTIMIDSEGYSWTTEKGNYVGMPTHDGTTTMTGNSGNGYAKITLIGLI